MFSNVWSENTALFERLMEIHSNSQKLYYGFKDGIDTMVNWWCRKSWDFGLMYVHVCILRLTCS